MDGSTFDTLTRTMTTAGSRRRAIGVLSAGTLGLLATRTEEAAAKKKPCPPCKKRKDGKCKKKKPDGRLCAGGTCHGGKCIAAPGPSPTCSDGITNGTESDVDCGGSCSRCTNGKSCVGRDDCIGALCINNVCTSCSAIGNECFSDAHGDCTCRNGIIGPVCTSSKTLDKNVPCTSCPPGTTACTNEGPDVFCFGPCGGV